MSDTQNCKVFTDGASKGNPGPASIGVACFLNEAPTLERFKQDPDAAYFKISERVGDRTNNEAEYLSLIKALEQLAKRNILKATIFMDSELVVKQLNGLYKVKSKSLQPYWEKAKLLQNGKNYRFEHITRDKNQIADYLANLAFQHG